MAGTMLFNSITFLMFFPVVTIVFFSFPNRYRWAVLLAASYIFYMWWKPHYLILILTSTILDYFVGQKIHRAVPNHRKFKWLALSVVGNLSILFTFKYFNFFARSIEYSLDMLEMGATLPRLDVVLPVGISFYTFQTLSYTIDVYRGQKEPESHLGYFALYVSFFPSWWQDPLSGPLACYPS